MLHIWVIRLKCWGINLININPWARALQSTFNHNFWHLNNDAHIYEKEEEEMLRCKIRMMRTGPPKTRDRWSFWKKSNCPSERWPWRWRWTRRLTRRGTRSWLSSLDIKDDEYWLDHPDQRTVGHSEKKQLSVRANVASKLWRMAGKIKTIATLMNHFQNNMYCCCFKP